MKVLITGANGNIGHYLSIHLKSQGLEVIEVGKSANILDKALINFFVFEHQPDCLVNLAAQSSITKSWEEPRQTFDTNVNGVINCLEAIRTFKPTCRFLNAGSLDELVEPKSIYGASKLASRAIVKIYREKYGIYAIQPYLGNTESPRRPDSFISRKITKAVARIKAGDYSFLNVGNLDQKVSWNDAEDISESIWLALNQNQNDLFDYFLCSSEFHTIREFLETAFEIAGIEIHKIGQEKPGVQYLFSGGRPIVFSSEEFFRPTKSVKDISAEVEKTKNSLQWRPKVSFYQLINKMVKNDIILTERELRV